MRHWRITGNSNVAIQTGSTYISDSMTDITEIPTANLRFSTTPTAKKLTRAIAIVVVRRRGCPKRRNSTGRRGGIQSDVELSCVAINGALQEHERPQSNLFYFSTYRLNIFPSVNKFLHVWCKKKRCWLHHRIVPPQQHTLPWANFFTPNMYW